MLTGQPISILVSLIVGAISVATTFYIKDALQKRAQYASLRKKLEQVAGKNAVIIYNPGAGMGMGPQPYKIVEVDRFGVTVQNNLHKIFVPASKVVQSEMILPCDDYENARLAQMRKEFEQVVDAMVTPLFEKMLPAFKEFFMDEFMDEGSEFTAVIGVKMQKLLKDEGFELKKIEQSRRGP